MFSSVSGMDVNQLCNAYVSWFNLWDYEMSVDTLNALTCESEGNLLTMNDMLYYGAAGPTYDVTFDCGKYYQSISK